MTDILYRGKAINRNPNQSYRTTYKNGDWVYGLVSRLNEYFTEMTNENGVCGIDVDRDTICRYSGECDKNCNRIFEHDILKDDNGFIYHVVFENGAFCLASATRYNIPYDTLPSDIDLDEFDGALADNVVSFFALKWNSAEWYKNFEIIGNKYDNPELLERGAK